jgi:hypothetical protein
LGLLGDAVSQAEMGPYAGTPRNPQLKIGSRAYAVVRYARHYIAYTTIHVDPGRCRRCGQGLVEVHRIGFIRGEGPRMTVGAVRTCRSCQADSWLLHSWMPATARARRKSRKVVL